MFATPMAARWCRDQPCCLQLPAMRKEILRMAGRDLELLSSFIRKTSGQGRTDNGVLESVVRADNVRISGGRRGFATKRKKATREFRSQEKNGIPARRTPGPGGHAPVAGLGIFRAARRRGGFLSMPGAKQGMPHMPHPQAGFEPN